MINLAAYKIKREKNPHRKITGSSKVGADLHVLQIGKPSTRYQILTCTKIFLSPLSPSHSNKYGNA
jgi:hypothetical protein